MKGKFQNQLEKLVLYKIILLIGAGILLFLLGLVIINFCSSEHNASKNMDILVHSFEEQYHFGERILTDEEIQDTCRKIIRGELLADHLTVLLKRRGFEKGPESRVLLTDGQGRIYYSSFHEEELTNYLLNYNGAVCYHAGEEEGESIYASVYYESGKYSDYILLMALKEGKEIQGYLSLYLSGSGWNYRLSENNYDGVITDSKGNIIYCSKASFMENHGKFKPEKRFFFYRDNERYWMRELYLPAYQVTVYSLIYAPGTPTWIAGVLIVCSMGIVWYSLARSMSDAMAANNSRMINQMVKEIRVIQSGNIDYRIQMNFDNEFDEAACQINHMLDNIQQLNERNMELIRLNNMFELNQLMAQINPHFLYNTLEMIRNLVRWDPETTSSLILKLTQILRYSVDRNCQNVCLKEDISYLTDYLDIQKCRFGERFQCEMDIEPVCMDCMVPKLILQPIIENSIKYGFKKKMHIRVFVHGFLERGILRIAVTDDGPGMSREDAERLNYSMRQVCKDNHSLGLHNISRRLYLQYGEESGILVHSKEGKGMTVTVSIVQKGEERHV